MRSHICPDCGVREVHLPAPLPKVGDDFDWLVRDYDGFRMFMLEELAALVAFKNPVDMDQDFITKKLLESMQKHKPGVATKNIKEKLKFDEESFDRLAEIGLSPRRDAFQLIAVD